MVTTRDNGNYIWASTCSQSTTISGESLTQERQQVISFIVSLAVNGLAASGALSGQSIGQGA